MAAAFVQAAQGGANTSASSVATGSFTTTTGNALFVTVRWDRGPAATITGITDPNGNAFTLIGAIFTDANNNGCQNAYRLNVTGATGACTVTFSTSVAFRNVVAHEVSGILTAAALDQDSGGSEETSATPTDTAVVTTTNGQYIFCSVYNGGGTASNTFSAGATFTEPGANSTSNAASNELMTEYQIQGSAGSVTAAFTRTASGLCNMRTSTFKATAPTTTDGVGSAAAISAASAVGSAMAMLVPDADITDGGWLTDTGGTSLFAAIDEAVASDTDYIVSSDTDTDTCEIRLSDPSTTVARPFSVAYRYKRIGSDDITLRVALMEGATQRASWDTAVSSGTFTDAEQFLTAPEFAAITDFTDLRVRFTAIRAVEDVLTLEGDFSGDLTLEGDFSGSLLLEGT